MSISTSISLIAIPSKLELDADNHILNGYSYSEVHHYGEEIQSIFLQLL